MNNLISIFVFGTLLDDILLTHLVGSHPKAEPVCYLHDHKIILDSYPSIVPEKGAIVPGKIVYLTQDQVNKLQKWESSYDLLPAVVFQDGTNKPTNVFAFFKKKDEKKGI